MVTPAFLLAAACTVLLMISSPAISTATATAATGLKEGEMLFWFPPFWNRHDPDVAACWSSVHDTEGCAVRDLLVSFFTHRVYVSPGCCRALDGVSEHCLDNLFSNAPFNPFFPPLVKEFCASYLNPPSPLSSGPTPPPPLYDLPSPSISQGALVPTPAPAPAQGGGSSEKVDGQAPAPAVPNAPTSSPSSGGASPPQSNDY